MQYYYLLCYSLLLLTAVGSALLPYPLAMWFLLSSLLTWLIYGADKLAARKAWRRVPETTLLVLGLAALFGCLFFFKYAGLLGLGVTLPLAISFYSFQLAAYLIDVYRGRVTAETKPLLFFTGVLLFPKLLSGPLMDPLSLQQQLSAPPRPGLEDFDSGLRDFVLGLSMKVLLANQIGGLWRQVGNIGYESVSTPLAWMGIAAYSLQLYLDFCGYSWMALGLGRMLGFRLPRNFEHPYAARSMRDFWRRWHMSLGTWFRDYVYIPLGGNRVSVLRWCFNMFVVWLLSGLWHGAGWNFALWGLYFGVFLSAEKLIGKKWKERSFKIADVSANNDSNGGNRKNMFLICARNSIEHGYVLLVVLFSFVIFRVEGVREIKEQFLGLSGCYGNVMTPMAAYEIKSCLILLLIACAGATPFPAMWVQRLKNTNMWKKSGWLLQSCYILTGLVLATAFLLGSSVHPFLYFRF